MGPGPSSFLKEADLGLLTQKQQPPGEASILMASRKLTPKSQRLKTLHTLALPSSPHSTLTPLPITFQQERCSLSRDSIHAVTLTVPPSSDSQNERLAPPALEGRSFVEKDPEYTAEKRVWFCFLDSPCLTKAEPSKRIQLS